MSKAKKILNEMEVPQNGTDLLYEKVKNTIDNNPGDFIDLISGMLVDRLCAGKRLEQLLSMDNLTGPIWDAIKNIPPYE